MTEEINANEKSAPVDRIPLTAEQSEQLDVIKTIWNEREKAIARILSEYSRDIAMFVIAKFGHDLGLDPKDEWQFSWETKEFFRGGAAKNSAEVANTEEPVAAVVVG